MGVLLQRGFVILLWVILIFSNISTLLIKEVQSCNVQVSLNESGILSDGNYTVHDPITIITNTDLKTQLWPGNGTAASPFLINELEIDNDHDPYAIEIWNVDAHVLINQCRIIGDIYIKESSNIKIANSNISEAGQGISIEDSQNISITFIYISECLESGVHLKDSTNCIVRNSSFHDIGYIQEIPITCWPPRSEYYNYGDAIWLKFSNNCTIDGNIISNILVRSILLEDSHYCSIIGNTIQFRDVHLIRSNNLSIIDNSILSEHGEMLLSDCRYAEIINNSLGGGLDLEGDYSSYIHEFESNIAYGEPLGYFSGFSNITIDAEEFGQIILFNCSNMYLSRGSFTGIKSAIKIAYSKNCIISNVYVSYGTGVGLHLIRSQNCIIENCSIDAYKQCIEIIDTEHCIIRNNQIYSTTLGINLTSSYSTIVTRNKLSQIKNTAILVTTSDRTTIYDNVINDCANVVSVTGYPEKQVYFNSVWIRHSQYCNITGNIIANSTGRGIVLLFCSHCSILKNTYSGNMQGDAYDIDGVNNTWDITPYTQYVTGSFDEHQNQYFTTIAAVSIIGIVTVAITIIIFRRRKQ